MPYYRSVFISDLHLGSPWCQVEELLGFLSSVQCDHLYLVGDVFDGCRPARGRKWPRGQMRVLKMLRTLSQSIEVTYVTGNHDEFMRREHRLRRLFERTLPDIRLCDSAVHRFGDGRKYLVIHGDKYDPALRVPLLGRIGTWLYVHLRSLAERFPMTFRGLGLASETLESALMHWQDDLTRLWGDPESKMMRDVARQGYDGVICGHTHLAALRRSHGLVYANCGYWTGPSHAVVEQPDGRPALLPWSDSWAPSAATATATQPQGVRS
ncbi:MAG: UDP-2,3-diacylglucosamine diphosphatase [Candidatus Adiutrix sp.]|nr:UDP-2,3-diacylglucosamine diphosphatase [Candidatus Adiutrix sp.]